MKQCVMRCHGAWETGGNMKPNKNRKGLTSKVYNHIIIYTLYDTEILKYTNSGLIQLDSGGWRTNHTKKCMNDNLPKGYRVYQKNFEWYVDTPKKSGLVFEDGMYLS